MRTDAGAMAIDVDAAAKRRPRSEVVLRAVQPVANVAVRAAARLGIDPQLVVWSHAALGAAAAVLIVVGDVGAWRVAAGLLLIKAFLDNVDGSLARATGRVTVMGRYLDTVLDTIVNALLFAALAVHGPGMWAVPLALGGYAALVVVLSLDFNLERRYKALRGLVPLEADGVPAGAPERWLAAFRGFYERFLEPQDVAIDRLDERAFVRVTDTSYETAPLDQRLAWNDLWSTSTLVNLGLTTQMAVLAACLALGAPFAYVLLVYAMAAYVGAVQLLRVVRFRRGGAAA
ncbi:MAG: CDP-alcohol phosphatidyltransferase family protein [Trueperaceae bacterium]